MSSPLHERTTDRDIHSVLAQVWGYDRFRPKQEEIVRAVLAGQDTLALLPTGGGKSLCFQVPALAMGKLCLVVSPLIALMKDQVGRLKKLGVPARAIVSTMSAAEIDNALESAALGKYAFLYVSPERLASDMFLARLPRLPLGLIAVDEAHCISQWGYDFRPAYLKIGEVRAVRPEVPVIALTASATGTVVKDIMEKLSFRTPHVVRGSFRRPELTLWVSKGEDKQGRLLKVMQNVQGTSIVYVRERRSTTRIATLLTRHGVSAAAYHAGLPSEERDRIQQEWTEGSLRCMVATNAFGMGIDKADVRSVVHLEPPADLESYYQEAGRAGRDGRTSYAFLLTGPGDLEKMRERLLSSFPSIDHVRKVYQAFADAHGIALGSGLLETYPVDTRALATRTALPALTITHSLKALELDGKLALSEGLRSPSRVLIIADQRVIYQMRVNDTRHGPLIETLLRMYGGLYEEPVIIDELRMARALKWQTETVLTRLRELDQQKVLSYRQRSDSPSATLLLPRMDAQRMVLDPAALALRKERATLRMQAMIDFMDQVAVCRSKQLVRYFDEQQETDCGTCDICRSRGRSYTSTAFDTKVVAEPLVPLINDLHLSRWEEDESGPLRSKQE